MEDDVIDFGFGPACPKTYILGKLAPKRRFKGVFSDFVTAHAQKRPEYYFRFQNGLRIRNRHAQNPICREILPQKRHFDPFTANFVFWQRLQWAEYGFYPNFNVFPPKFGVDYFFTILTPKRHFLTPKRIFWPMNGENRSSGPICAVEQELRKEHCFARSACD